MNNIVLSTRDIDDFISDLANEVVRKIELWQIIPSAAQKIIDPPDPSDSQDDLLTTKQVAKLLGLTVATIYGKIHNKELPYIKPPGSKRVYFSRKAILEFINTGKVKTTAEVEAEAETVVSVKPKSKK